MTNRHYVFRKKRNLFAARLLDALGGLIPRGRAPEPIFGRVLVVRLDHLGDMLTATAVPRMILEQHSGARVTMLTATWARPLFDNNPYVEEVLPYDAPWFLKGRYEGGTQSFRDTARALAARQFDVALAPRGDLRENWLLRMAGIPCRIGYGITGGGFLLTKEVPYRPGVHETEHTTDLLRAAGIRGAYPGPQLYFSSEEQDAWSARAASLGLPPGGRYVGFQTGAGTPAKEWGSARALHFVALARKLGATIVLTGTENDRARGPLPEATTVDLRGQTSLRELCLFIRTCRAFVGPDSGPTHLAAALGVPTVFLYSGTNRFEEWCPLPAAGKQGWPEPKVLRHPVQCSPCALEECPVEGHPCMAGITPDDVARSLAEVLV